MEETLVNEDIEEKNDKFCSSDLKYCLSCFGISISICVVFDILLLYLIKIEDSSNSN
tara:strand:+ start:377 stop:547 length:171 start_codon:yes stop_codon:yes gene_type:complete